MSSNLFKARIDKNAKKIKNGGGTKGSKTRKRVTAALLAAGVGVGSLGLFPGCGVGETTDVDNDTITNASQTDNNELIQSIINEMASLNEKLEDANCKIEDLQEELSSKETLFTDELDKIYEHLATLYTHDVEILTIVLNNTEDLQAQITELKNSQSITNADIESMREQISSMAQTVISITDSISDLTNTSNSYTGIDEDTAKKLDELSNLSDQAQTAINNLNISFAVLNTFKGDKYTSFYIQGDNNYNYHIAPNGSFIRSGGDDGSAQSYYNSEDGLFFEGNMVYKNDDEYVYQNSYLNIFDFSDAVSIEETESGAYEVTNANGTTTTVRIVNGEIISVHDKLSNFNVNVSHVYSEDYATYNQFETTAKTTIEGAKIYYIVLKKAIDATFKNCLYMDATLEGDQEVAVLGVDSAVFISNPVGTDGNLSYSESFVDDGVTGTNIWYDINSDGLVETQEEKSNGVNITTLGGQLAPSFDSGSSLSYDASTDKVTISHAGETDAENYTIEFTIQDGKVTSAAMTYDDYSYKYNFKVVTEDQYTALTQVCQDYLDNIVAGADPKAEYEYLANEVNNILQNGFSFVSGI